MSLSASKHVILDKSIYYSVNVVNGLWEYFEQNIKKSYTIAYEYHRYCTQQIEWVGCSEEQATALKNQLISKYKRTIYNSFWSPDDKGFSETYFGTNLMADVSMAQTKGHMYTVTLNVREEDVKMRLYPSSNASALFTDENNREYD